MSSACRAGFAFIIRFLGLAAVAVQAAEPELPEMTERGRPNILFFFVDDMGWQDTSVPFHSELTPLNGIYRTPNMERLAAQGMKFRQAYACAVCSPSRISWMTGLNAARHGVTNWTLRKDKQPDTPNEFVEAAKWNLNGLSPVPGVSRTVHAKALPMFLRESGYRTIHCGKAHFGATNTPGADPRNLGFDINIGGHAAGGPGSYYGTNNFSADFRNGDRIWDVPGLEAYHGQDIYLNEALTREAIKAVEASVTEDRPFFLYMAHYAIHAPVEPDSRFLQAYLDAGLPKAQAHYASMIESMDRSLGDLMDCLERLGVADNTIVIFMSDNGAAKHAPLNKPLRGHKLLPYEGGVRVPLIVRWPGVTQEASECADRYVIIEDLFPTLLEMAGVTEFEQIGGAMDGRSFVSLLKGNASAIDYTRPIFWHFPNTYDQQPYSSIRQGDWKLVYLHIGPRLELYNLADDLSESTDLADAMPERTDELSAILGKHLRDVEAAMPLDRKTSKSLVFPDEFQRQNESRPTAIRANRKNLEPPAP